MFCLFNNIFICSVNELPFLNLNNFNYIINCSIKLNYLINNNNFININIEHLSDKTIDNFIQIYNFINININSKIIILDETGKDLAMFLGIFIIMKYYNIDFNNVYDNIKNYTHLYDKNYYLYLSYSDNFINNYMEVE